MCAPGDQRKSSDNQLEQAELNAAQCQLLADISGDAIASQQAHYWRGRRGGIAEAVVTERPLLAQSGLPHGRMVSDSLSGRRALAK